jgi:hypothetical protein
VKITAVSYQRTINLGNFESERVGTEVVLDEEGDSPEAAIALAREFVRQNSSLKRLEEDQKKFEGQRPDDEFDDTPY